MLPHVYDAFLKVRQEHTDSNNNLKYSECEDPNHFKINQVIIKLK